MRSLCAGCETRQPPRIHPVNFFGVIETVGKTIDGVGVAVIALGALIDLYRGAVSAGLVPFVIGSPDGHEPVERRDPTEVEDQPVQGQRYRPEDLF